MEGRWPTGISEDEALRDAGLEVRRSQRRERQARVRLPPRELRSLHLRH